MQILPSQAKFTGFDNVPHKIKRFKEGGRDGGKGRRGREGEKRKGGRK